jgi:valyl-tRNA synthetase
MLSAFPTGEANLIDERAESEMQAVIDLISRVRNIRAEMNIKPGEKISLLVSGDDKLQRVFAENEMQILKLARAGELKLSGKLDAPKASARAVLAGGAEIAVPLEGLIDFAKETDRLEKELTKLNSESEKLNAQLSNENFVSRAPVEKVEGIRARVAEISQQTRTLNQTLEALK